MVSILFQLILEDIRQYSVEVKSVVPRTKPIGESTLSKLLSVSFGKLLEFALLWFPDFLMKGVSSVFWYLVKTK